MGVSPPRIESLQDRLCFAMLAPAPVFGENGSVHLQYSNTSFYALHTKSDGVLLVGGQKDHDLLVLRLRANGQRDMSFGTKGRFKLDLGGNEQVTSITPDGNKWLIGVTDQNSDNFRVLRLTAKGKWDRSFKVRPPTPDPVTPTYPEWSATTSTGETFSLSRPSETGGFFLKSAKRTIALERPKLRSGPAHIGFETYQPDLYWGKISPFLANDSILQFAMSEPLPWYSMKKSTYLYRWNLATGKLVEQRWDGLGIMNSGSVAQDASGSLYVGSSGAADPDAEQILTSVALDGTTTTRLQLLASEENFTVTPWRADKRVAIIVNSSVLEGSYLELLGNGLSQRFDFPKGFHVFSDRFEADGSLTSLKESGQIYRYTVQEISKSEGWISTTDGNDTITVRQDGDQYSIQVNRSTYQMPAFEADPDDPSKLRLRVISIYSLEGNDSITVEGAIPAHVSAGGGRDTIRTGSANDIVFGDAGDDLIFLGAGDDNGDGNDGADNLFGGPGADQLFGGYQNDYLDGQDGADKLFGEYGNDTLVEYVLALTDTLDGGVGSDRAYHPDSRDQLVSIESNWTPPA